MRNKSSSIKTIVLSAVEALGYELWGCICLTQGSRKIIRIYIDSEKGVTLADCERVSRQVSALFDVESPLLARYLLEVSSPGLNRSLFTPEQFQRFIGHNVAIHTHTPIGIQRRFKGSLCAVNEEGIVLVSDGTELVLIWGNIMRANVLTYN